MPTAKLTKGELKKLNTPKYCNIYDVKIDSLSMYLEVITPFIKKNDGFWFRGQEEASWPLRPSALRVNKKKQIENLYHLFNDFKRIAESKLERPPLDNESLKWLQLAQHYGVPTRLLDWTESALFALYFACQNTDRNNLSDGIVYCFNSIDLALPTKSMRLNNELIDSYLQLKPIEEKNKKIAKPTLIIKPVWNSPRLMMQRGVFTLHGSKKLALDSSLSQTPSLTGFPILHKFKLIIKEQLDQIGIDEITLFPELEYVSKQLKRKYNI